jgi:hypothetical protein
MTDKRTTPPPADLLGAGAAEPKVRTLLAEVRSDASLPFDPKEAPAFLLLDDVAFGALVLWRVDLSWSEAQQIQLWLTGAPTGVPGATREEALQGFFENLRAPPPAPPDTFIEYVGTYLTTGTSHASYTLVLGMRVPHARDAYQTAFQNSLNVIGPPSWRDELISFIRMMLNQPSSREEFLTLASIVGDLSNGPPLIQLLIP